MQSNLSKTAIAGYISAAIVVDFKTQLGLKLNEPRFAEKENDGYLLIFPQKLI